MNARLLFATSIVSLLPFLIPLGSQAAPAIPIPIPALSINRANEAFILSWPASATDWVLEETIQLSPSSRWTPVPSEFYALDGDQLYLAGTAPLENRFYRLRHPGPPIEDLSGFWSLDEGQGQTAQPAASIAAGNLHLENVGWTAGRIGPSALQFFGGPADGNGSRAWIENIGYKVLPPPGEPLAVSCWFRPDLLTSRWQGLLGNDAFGSNGWHVALFSPGPGTNHLVFEATGPGGDWLAISGRTLLVPGQWHQLMIVHAGFEGRLYLDGQLLASGPGDLPAHEGPLYFGGGFGGFDSFSGAMDHFRVFTNAPSTKQVSLTGQFLFDETAGLLAADSSLQGHHAILTAAAARTPGKDGGGIDPASSALIIQNKNQDLLPPSGQPFSVSAWLLPSLPAAGRIGLMHCTEGNQNGWQVAIEMLSPTQAALHWNSTDSGGTLDLHSTVTLSNGVWTKLDLTYDGGIASVYVNGTKVHADRGAIRAGRAPLIVGAAPGALNFNGTIDELEIHRRELHPSEIGPVAPVLWETTFINVTTNIVLPGAGPAGRQLTYTLLPNPAPTNGTIAHAPGSPVISYQAGSRKGPDAFAYTVSDGEFTSPPAIVTVSVVEPHWLSVEGGPLEPRDGTRPERAWLAGTADALQAIWHTNNYYDCFYYGPGVYLTRGGKFQERPTANPGCKHIGAGLSGPNQTTLRLIEILEATGVDVIFRMRHGLAYCDGFELHHLVLDCNADNVPKYTRGEPGWIRIPLTTTNLIDTVTLRWADRPFPGALHWRLGPAAEFRIATKKIGSSDEFITNAVRTSDGLVDVVPIGVPTDELLVQLNLRAPGVNFYGLAEIEISGGTASLPSATSLDGNLSQLDFGYPLVSAVDGDRRTSWASHAGETEVRIALPLAPGSEVSRLDFRWNCDAFSPFGRFGRATQYFIRARDELTGDYYDVPFVPQNLSDAGLETARFGTPETPATIVTDELIILLLERESEVDYYSIEDLTLWNGAKRVPLRLPTASRTLNRGTHYQVLRAFDQTTATEWASGTQGMVGAMNACGNNMKFTNLRVIGFGTKAGRECFPLGIAPTIPPDGSVSRHGNILVEDCIFTDPATNSTGVLTAVALIPHPPALLTNAIVRRCSVTGVRRFFNVSQAFTATHVENCYVEDCSVGVYFEPDTGGTTEVGPVLIRSNLFVNVRHGVYLLDHPSAQFDSLTVVDNEIVLTKEKGWGLQACDTCDPGPSGWMTNLVALRNVIRYPDWQPRPINLEGGLFYSDIHHAVFGNNVIALGTRHSLRLRNCPAGRIVQPRPPELCDNPLPPPPVSISTAPCLDFLPPGYRRAWFNNRDLSGNLLPVRHARNGLDGLASDQQWPE